ncbi:hypothetical protein D3C75_1177840 [compost metagenome]
MLLEIWDKVTKRRDGQVYFLVFPQSDMVLEHGFHPFKQIAAINGLSFVSQVFLEFPEGINNICIIHIDSGDVKPGFCNQ